MSKKTSTQLADILFPTLEETDRTDSILDIPPEQRRLHTETVDFSVSTIVEALENNTITIPQFQRRYVWSDSQASRLIESLIIQCPIPVIYLSQSPDESLQVIDGNQRLRSLRRFLENDFKLKGLTAYPELEGNTFAELDPRFQRHIRNRTIRCMIILKDTHPQVQFDVFERLNSGSVKLTPQELRHGIYFGDPIKIAEKCAAENKVFQGLLSIGHNKRMRVEELVIRFWALSQNLENYKKPLNLFLNAFCERSKHLSEADQGMLRESFNEAVELVAKHFGELAFKVFDDRHKILSSFNSSIYDCQMVGLWILKKNGKLASGLTRSQSIGRMAALIKDETFLKQISKATSDEGNVKGRIAKFITHFK